MTTCDGVSTSNLFAFLGSPQFVAGDEPTTPFGFSYLSEAQQPYIDVISVNGNSDWVNYTVNMVEGDSVVIQIRNFDGLMDADVKVYLGLVVVPTVTLTETTVSFTAPLTTHGETEMKIMAGWKGWADYAPFLGTGMQQAPPYAPLEQFRGSLPSWWKPHRPDGRRVQREQRLSDQPLTPIVLERNEPEDIYNEDCVVKPHNFFQKPTLLVTSRGYAVARNSSYLDTRFEIHSVDPPVGSEEGGSRVTVRGVGFGNKQLTPQWTFALYATIMALGICYAMLGPTLLDLTERLQCSGTMASLLFSARAGGYLLGSTVGGPMVDRSPNPALLLLWGTVGSAIGAFCVPFLRHLPIAYISQSLQGLSMGLLDTGGNVLMLTVWRGSTHVNGAVHGFHFLFGLGAFIAPLCVSFVLRHDADAVQAWFVPVATYAPACVALLLLSFQPQPKTAAEDSEAKALPRIVLLTGAFLLTYVGLEVAFGGYAILDAKDSGNEVKEPLHTEVPAPIPSEATVPTLQDGAFNKLRDGIAAGEHRSLHRDVLGTLETEGILDASFLQRLRRTTDPLAKSRVVQCARKVVRHPAFEPIVGVMILTNLIIQGFEIEHSLLPDPKGEWPIGIEISFLTFYIMERADLSTDLSSIGHRFVDVLCLCCAALRSGVARGWQTARS
eukprot:g15823.t1